MERPNDKAITIPMNNAEVAWWAHYLKGSWVKGATNLEYIMQHTDTAEAFMEHANGLHCIYGIVDRNSVELAEVVDKYGYGERAVTWFLNTFFDWNYGSLQEFARSQGAVRVALQSRNALNAIFMSASAVRTLFSESVFVGELAENRDALNFVEQTPFARTVVSALAIDIEVETTATNQVIRIVDTPVFVVNFARRGTQNITVRSFINTPHQQISTNTNTVVMNRFAEPLEVQGNAGAIAVIRCVPLLADVSTLYRILNARFNWTYSNLTAIFESEEAMSTIVGDAGAINIVMGSSESRAALLNSDIALAAIFRDPPTADPFLRIDSFANTLRDTATSQTIARTLARLSRLNPNDFANMEHFTTTSGALAAAVQSLGAVLLIERTQVGVDAMNRLPTSSIVNTSLASVGGHVWIGTVTRPTGGQQRATVHVSGQTSPRAVSEGITIDGLMLAPANRSVGGTGSHSTASTAIHRFALNPRATVNLLGDQPLHGWVYDWNIGNNVWAQIGTWVRHTQPTHNGNTTFTRIS
ncbi:MAG: hypothetical protein FWE12_00670 [Oscillospiraceae bacterium]|nr:hypothetical protein [Oscillospiraceae bacterium]